MGRSKIQTRADADTKDALDEYAEKHDLTQSEAVRSMIRAGLSQHGYEIATADGGTANVADQIDTLQSEQAARLDQLQWDGYVLASGLAVGVIGALIAVAGLSPVITVGAVAVGVITVAAAFGATVFRRVITE